MGVIEQFKKVADKYDSMLAPLLDVEKNGEPAKIIMHEVRWLGNGSGDIVLNGGVKHRFYLDEDGILNVNDDLLYLQNHLKEVVRIFREKDHELNKIMFPW
ncbi:hypothetical protein ACIFOE_04700 [Paenibacillus sp. NRS-1783]|uniref:hypothetical protein n=1 Tax=Paenibacillus sp. NRS-1783 TaxID=3233907 RepID=UPI003D294B88